MDKEYILSTIQQTLIRHTNLTDDAAYTVGEHLLIDLELNGIL